MRSLADYLALIPPEHAKKPKFVATVALSVRPYADIQAFLQCLPEQFDLDKAIGVQLDATGAWIGRSRDLLIPIANAFFSFDTPGLGFDQGYWKQNFEAGDSLTKLDDDTYRRLLRAVILANNSDGTIPDIQASIDKFFDPVDYPGTQIWVVDGSSGAAPNLFFSFDDPLRGFDTGTWFQPGQEISPLAALDMAMTVGLSGRIPKIVDLEILQQLLIPFKTAGARLDWAVTTNDGGPVFGFDIENEFIAGFDVGGWGATPGYVAQNIPTGVSVVTTESGAPLTTESGAEIQI